MVGLVWAKGIPITVYPSPWEQISSSSTLVYRTLQALVSPRSDVGVGHLSGAIGIFNTIMKILRYDPAQLLAFCVMFNVNLALLNMMPIPILDGGHIVFSLIEAIRRRPVSVKIMSAVQTVAFVLMIGLFLFISYRDVLRVGRGSGSSKQEKSDDVQFSEAAGEVKN
jgi:regulator of sigma E protease